MVLGLVAEEFELDDGAFAAFGVAYGVVGVAYPDVAVFVELDFAVNVGLVPEVLKPRGMVVIYGNSKPIAEVPTGFCLQNQIRLQSIFVYELNEIERARTIAEIMRLMQEDRLIHNIAATFPLSEIVAAHEAVEKGAMGNVVVKL